MRSLNHPGYSGSLCYIGFMGSQQGVHLPLRPPHTGKFVKGLGTLIYHSLGSVNLNEHDDLSLGLGP